MTNGASASRGVTAMRIMLRLWITTKTPGEMNNEAVKATRSNPSRRDSPGRLHETTGDQHKQVGSRSGRPAQPHQRHREWRSFHHGRYRIEVGDILPCFAGNLARVADGLRSSGHPPARWGSDCP